MVVVFTAGFLMTPFFQLLPHQIVNPVVATIFLLGAIYVWITIRPIHRIIGELAA